MTPSASEMEWSGPRQLDPDDPDYARLSDVAFSAVERVAYLHEHPELRGLTTSVSAELDDEMDTTLRPGSLVLLGGPTGRGKTALLAQLAVAFSTQLQTFWEVLEDEQVDASMRAIAAVTRHSIGDLRRGFRDRDQLPDEVIAAIEILSGTPVGVTRAQGFCVCELLKKWRRVMTRYGLPSAAFVVDQLSHVRACTVQRPDPRTGELVGCWNPRTFPGWKPPPPDTAATHDKLDWVVETLCAGAKRLHVVVILAAQLTIGARSGKTPISLESLAKSKNMTHHPQAVLLLNNPDRIKPEFPTVEADDDGLVPNVNGDATIYGLKIRFGSEFRVDVRFVGAQQRYIGRNDDATTRFRTERSLGAAATRAMGDFAAIIAEQRDALEAPAILDAAQRAAVEAADADVAEAGMVYATTETVQMELPPPPGT